MRRASTLAVVAGVITLAVVASAAALAQVPSVGARAEVRDAAGRLVATVDFREGRGEVLVAILFPTAPVLSGSHAVHINDTGRCDPPDFATSGRIFNPFNKKHGRLNSEGAEVGDLPNVNFTAGPIIYNTSAIGATLGAGAGSLLSPARSVVIFSGEDDQKTDPEGNAGARIACGVISVPVAAAAQPAVIPVSPVASPLPVAKPVSPVASPLPAARPASPVIAVATRVVIATPILASPAPPPATQPSSGADNSRTLVIGFLGLALIVSGYLLRRRNEVQRTDN